MQEQAEEGAIPVDCWLGGPDALRDTCLVETVAEGFVVRHPDGGFRRFGVDGNGALQPLDGIDTIGIGEEPGGTMDVVIAGDRYRLPSELAR